MRQPEKNRKLVDKFVRQTSEHGEIKLIAGVNLDPPNPHPNAIFYIRMESQDGDTEEPCKTQDIWLSLNDMTRLSVLMNIASRFWTDRYEKGEPYSEKRITDFLKEYGTIKKSLKRLLPKPRFQKNVN
jgi:hypothetical protein